MKPRLLKRIKSWEEAGVVSASEVDVNDMMESLRDDLEKLLNTRRGTVLVDDEYGLPDFTHLMNGYAAPDLDQIQRDLTNQIKRYETRLESIMLTFQEPKSRATSVMYGLNAKFSHRNQPVDFVATVQFIDNGSVSVGL